MCQAKTPRKSLLVGIFFGGEGLADMREASQNVKLASTEFASHFVFVWRCIVVFKSIYFAILFARLLILQLLIAKLISNIESKYDKYT
jgi:hypothetical protein